MILVTGASGFVGRHVIKIAGSFSKALYRNVSSGDGQPFESVESFDETTDFSAALEGIDVIVHLAGIAHAPLTPESEYLQVNVDGTLNLARQATDAGVKRFVFVSTIGVNGAVTSNAPFTVDDEPCPVNHYTRSKYEAEKRLRILAENTGLELVIVRPTLVYGANAAGNFGQLCSLVSRVPILPFGLAENRKSFISVENLADLLIVCANHPNAPGHTFLASEQNPLSIKEFTNEIAEGLGKKLLQVPVPLWGMRLLGKVIRKEAIIEQLFGDLEVDPTDTYKILGWTPKFTMKQTMKTLKR